LVIGDGLAEGACDSFDDSAHVEREFHPVNFLKRKPRNPLAEFACDFGLFYSGVFPDPLGNTPIDAGTERFHEIVGERGGAFADDVADAKGGIEADGEKVLKYGREKNCVSVVEKRVGAIAFAAAQKAIGLSDVVGVNAPKDFGAFGFFCGGAAVGVKLESFEAFIAWGDFTGKGELVAAFRVDSFVPEALF